MTGRRGVAATTLDLEGCVRIRGELWRAVVADELKKIPGGRNRLRCLSRWLEIDGAGV